MEKDEIIKKYKERYGAIIHPNLLTDSELRMLDFCIAYFASELAEPEGQQYHLTCERCGDIFWSYEAFPKPQLCNKCSKPEVKTAEEINPDFDYEYDKMTLAQKILTDYSDGHYTMFPGYENILMAMEEYASQFQEQPITVTNKMIKAKAFELCPVLYIPRITGNKKDDINKDTRKTIIDAIKWALSLKAQKAQPGDEDIEVYIIARYPIIELEDKEGNKMDANNYFRKCLIKELKAMRDGKIPVSGKDEKA